MHTFNITGFTKGASSSSLTDIALQHSTTHSAITSLNAEIVKAEANQLASLPQLYYLRGCYYLSGREVRKAFDDFENILKLDASVFPQRLILFAMYELTKEEFAALPVDFFEHNAIWRSLYEQASEKNEFLRKTQLTSDPMIEIGSLQEYLESIKGSEFVDVKTFLNILKLLGITHEATVAETLQNAIRSIDASEGPPNSISESICMQFVEVWRGLLQNKKQQIAHQLKINPEEEVIKVLPLVRILDRGDGTLILTSRNMLFVPHHTNLAIILAPLNKITEIKKFQHKKLLPPGYPALFISVAIDSMAAKAAKKPSDKVESVHTYSVLFFSERDEWFSYLKEMQNAHIAADKLRDSLLVPQAACNIALVEAVSRVCFFLNIWVAQISLFYRYSSR